MTATNHASGAPTLTPPGTSSVQTLRNYDAVTHIANMPERIKLKR
jgi:hypothetical protein